MFAVKSSFVYRTQLSEIFLEIVSTRKMFLHQSTLVESLPKVVCLFLSANQTNDVDYAKDRFEARAEKGKMGKTQFCAMNWI